MEPRPEFVRYLECWQDEHLLSLWYLRRYAELVKKKGRHKVESFFE